MYCSKCESSNITRICVDCGNNFFCDQCYIDEHSGSSSQHHMVRDSKCNAIILDSSRNSKLNSHSEESDHIPDYIFPTSFLLGDDPEKPTSPNLSPIKLKNASSPGFEDQKIYSNNSDISITCPSKTNFLPSLSSTQIEEQCHIFESGKIKEFKSIEEIAAVLQIDESLTKFRVPIVTFIGKPLKDESVANILLLKNNTIKFVEGANRTQNPLCTMIYDSANHLLVLETQNMYKEVDKYINEQKALLNVLLALSDVIIFSENVIRKDYIRMYKMMDNCKTRFGTFFSKIDKANPDRLAPALIYLQLRKSEITDSLPTVIQNAIGRENLFCCYNEMIFFDIIGRNDFESFDIGLTKILNEISKVRSMHSLEEIFGCISNCKESLSYAQDNVASNDIPNCWFFCNILCQICQKRCSKPFNHEGTHDSDSDCLPNNQNEVYFCKQCMSSNGKGVRPLVLKPMSKEEGFLKNILSYPFRRGLVECDIHHIIHDNNWLSTSYNAQDNIHTEYCHKWPGQKFMSEHIYPVGQTIIDKVNEISDPVVRVVTKSTEFVSDTVQPSNWQSTSRTYSCSCCKEPFTKKMAKHHCRVCKLVICSSCCHPTQSARVCIVCFGKHQPLEFSEEDPKTITFFNIVRDSYQTCSTFLRRTVSNLTRPDYWENDETAINCFLCEKEFHLEINPIHHCRACGKCVCDKCSQDQKPVEWRCLFDPTRVCDKCIQNKTWRKPLD